MPVQWPQAIPLWSGNGIPDPFLPKACQMWFSTNWSFSLFFMPRSRPYKMFFHLTFLKQLALCKKMIGNTNSLGKKACLLYKVQGSNPIFFTIAARTCTCTGGQPTPKANGNATPLATAIFDDFPTMKPHFWWVVTWGCHPPNRWIPVRGVDQRSANQPFLACRLEHGTAQNDMNLQCLARSSDILTYKFQFQDVY